MSASQQPRRTRDLGIVVGDLPTGPVGAITDVPGVRVGHTTLIEGDDIRTGVTAIVADQLTSRRSLPAGLYVGNGYGKLVGSTQVVELGEIETPVVLTATLSVFRAADALLDHMLTQPGREAVQSLNPLVAETNDGFLSDIRARPIRAEHVLGALHSARAGLPAEGAVGAGTGTAALGFKAGIGTSSRVAPTSTGPVTVGVLAQANFSGVLRVAGVPVTPAAVGVPTGAPRPAYEPEHPGNSCVLVVATDGRFDARQLGRVARRAVFAMGRVGSDFAGGSGDYALAFSTAEPGGPAAESDLEPVFAAVQDAVAEALLNSLFMASTTVGYRGRVKYAVPHERMLALLREHRVELRT
ncbi:P1 family peptidase [Catellatospora tritici]|uniref:P1 family peptidase n=1 Tax=Catellatospora tritici TaxID=2851566 RepID=UPI0027E078F6|nr:P1 family peptidase [Catellatospora tritici]